MEGASTMGGWEIAAWAAVVLVTAFRVALVVGVIALVVVIVRAVLSAEPVTDSSGADKASAGVIG